MILLVALIVAFGFHVSLPWWMWALLVVVSL